MKKLIVFDLDGTLAESKSSLDAEMATLLSALLGIVKVAVISGGDWPQFEKQLLSNLPHDEHLKNLSLLPTCGTKFYQYESGWKKLYSEDFTDEEKEKIISSLKKVIGVVGLQGRERSGESRLKTGEARSPFPHWVSRRPSKKRKNGILISPSERRSKQSLTHLIPEFSVRLGGTTSVDVTKPGIDKAYGIRKLRDTLGIAIEEMIFVGDALFPGGNDYPAKEAGVVSIQVRDPNETKRVIEAIIACLDCAQATRPL